MAHEAMILEVKNVHAKKIVTDLSFSLPKGHMLGIAGASAQGKSLVLKLLAGLCRPDKGEILVDQKKDERERRQQISYLGSLPFYTREKTIRAEAKRWKAYFKDFDALHCIDLLSRYGLDQKAKLSELTPGGQKYLSLALTFSRKTKLYLLDAIEENMDQKGREIFGEIIIEKLSEGASVVCASSAPVLLERYFDDVLIVKRGEAAKFFAAEILREKRKEWWDDVSSLVQ